MNRQHAFFLLLAFVSVFMVPGCDPDENPFDPLDPRDQYLGTWTVQEAGKKKITYEVTISSDPGNSVQVLIDNFYNIGITPYAIVTSSTITLPQQTFSFPSVKVWGSGSYSNDKISWVYYVNDGADLDTVVSTYTRQ